MKNRMEFDHFNTRVIHTAQLPEEWQGSTLPPIFQTASHQHPTAEGLSETFAGKKSDHIYMRLTNPTNRVLEEKLTSLEGGAGAVRIGSPALTTRGMGAREMRRVAGIIARVVTSGGAQAALRRARREVAQLAQSFPVS